MTERHRRLVLLKVAWSFKDPIVRHRGRGGGVEGRIADRQAVQSAHRPDKR